MIVDFGTLALDQFFTLYSPLQLSSALSPCCSNLMKRTELNPLCLSPSPSSPGFDGPDWHSRRRVPGDVLVAVWLSDGLRHGGRTPSGLPACVIRFFHSTG